jgi:hypothetical protein
VSKPPKPGFVSFGSMCLAGLMKISWNSGGVGLVGSKQVWPLIPPTMTAFFYAGGFKIGSWAAREVIQSDNTGS